MTKATAIARTSQAGTGAARFSAAKSQKLLDALLLAEGEGDVDAIIESDPMLSDPANWIPVNRSENNFATVNNQSATAPKAACEMITNMMDAILLRFAVERGIDPRSHDAPKSIFDAVETFLGWKDGRMANGFDSIREAGDWARKHLMIAFAGAGNPVAEPTLTFCDAGEGQHPEDFDRTFMSLGEGGGKKAIKFVQGQYNMGSSGVLGYCGTRGYKLIVSRKHTLDGKWGWSLVRRRPNHDMIVYDYLKIGGLDGFIPFTDAKTIRPIITQDGNHFEEAEFEFGTAIKLYNYQIGADYRDYDGTRRAFYEHLVDTILPVRMLDLRHAASAKKGKHRGLGIDARTFCGLEYHISKGFALKDDEVASHETREGAKKGATMIDVGSFEDATLGKISVRAYFTDNDITRKVSDGGSGCIRSNNRVFYSVNGQVQHKHSRGYLTDCGLPSLKDHLAVVIDCSHLTTSTHHTIWKADRECMLDKTLAAKVVTSGKNLVSGCKQLQTLNDEVHQRSISSIVDSSTQLVFEKLVDRDPTLARLLNGDIPIMPAALGAITGEPDDRPKLPYDGLHSPEFFRFLGKSGEFELPRGGSVSVRTETNVNDDYLTREMDRGKLYVSGDLMGAGVSVIRETIRNGRISVTLKAPENAPLGSIPVLMSLRDGSMASDAAFNLEFNVKIVEATEPSKKPKPRLPREKKAKKIAVPNCKLMTRDGREVDGEPTMTWAEGWDEFDGGISSISRDNHVSILVNYDNIHLQDALRRANDRDRKMIPTKFKLAMQVGLLALERRITQMRENGTAGTEDEIDRVRRTMAAGLAASALTLVDHMPRVMMDKQDARADE